MRTEPRRADVGEYLKLLTYAEVRNRIAAALSRFSPDTERVAVDLALGRVSAEEVDSPFDIPEVSSSMMDGYAVRTSELKGVNASHPVSFRVTGSLSPASERPGSRLARGRAFYVATGAPVPPGSDAVVKVEETRLAGDRISVTVSLPRWKNIAVRGDDIKVGSPVVRPGQIVNAADIALLVAADRRELTVVRNPRVGVLSTGDELTSAGSREGGKKVNNYANLVAAYLADAGAIPVPLGVVPDDELEIAKKVEEAMVGLDALVTIGGSSVGKKDFTTKALRRLDGSEELFHGVRLVPARPTGMFLLRGKPVVVLPGHSVAAAVAFFLVVHPLVNMLSGLGFDAGTAQITARLAEGVANPRPVGALYLARLAARGGDYSATPLRWGSNLISSLAGANAFFEVEPRTTLRAGHEIAVTLLGASEIRRVDGGRCG